MQTDEREKKEECAVHSNQTTIRCQSAWPFFSKIKKNWKKQTGVNWTDFVFSSTFHLNIHKNKHSCRYSISQITMRSILCSQKCSERVFVCWPLRMLTSYSYDSSVLFALNFFFGCAKTGAIFTKEKKQARMSGQSTKNACYRHFRISKMKEKTKHIPTIGIG